MSQVFHIVQFKFKDGLPDDDIQAACDGMLSLKSNCISPTTGQPYILSTSGGKEMSIENRHNGFTHIFAVVFSSTKDRDYYVVEDPYHLDFAKTMTSKIQDVHVVDFSEGLFE